MNILRTSLAVQWLRFCASSAGGTGSKLSPRALWHKPKKKKMNTLRKAGEGGEIEVEGCLRKAGFLDAISKATRLALATRMVGYKHRKRL